MLKTILAELVANGLHLAFNLTSGGVGVGVGEGVGVGGGGGVG